jgi:hypothetical protein
MVPPVLLFAYRRDKHLSHSWQALAENREAPKTELHLFLDGAKNSEEYQAVSKTRDEAKRIKGFKRIYYHESSNNFGLSQSILSGIGAASKEALSWIVIEDDLVVGKHFLKFMHEALFCYGENTAVASIHGYVYPTSRTLPETFFMKGADCWGWATWSRAWKTFEPNGAKLLEQLRLRKLENDFDLGGGGPFTEILKQQIQGKNDSWAIRWHASAFLAGMHTLYPGRPLVKNIGLDNSGTHCCTSGIYDSEFSQTPIRVEPIPVVESEIGRKAFQEFFKEQR